MGQQSSKAGSTYGSRFQTASTPQRRRSNKHKIAAAASVMPASTITITFPIRLFKDGSTPIGILLSGAPDESPTIVEIDPSSLAARARPRLHVGMRLLAVNGQRVIGPSKIRDLLIAAVGEVWMEIEGLEGWVAQVESEWHPVTRVAQARRRFGKNGRNQSGSSIRSRATSAEGHASSEVPALASGVLTTRANVSSSGGVAMEASSQLQQQTSAAAQGEANPSHKQFNVVLSNPRCNHSLGLVLGGGSDEPPKIVRVMPNSIAARAEPKLLPGMRILHVDGNATSSPANTTMDVLQISLEQGSVTLNVECNAEVSTSQTRSREAASRSNRTIVQRHPPSSKRGWARGRNKYAAATAFVDNELDADVEGAEIHALGGFDAAEDGVLKPAAMKLVAVKLPAKAKRSMALAVADAVGSLGPGAASEDDGIGWTLEAWLTALEPHRVISSGLEALLQERVRERGDTYCKALEYHFVRSVGNMADEHAMKLLRSLIGHPRLVQVLSTLLLDGARVIARARMQTSAAAIRMPSLGADPSPITTLTSAADSHGHGTFESTGMPTTTPSPPARTVTTAETAQEEPTVSNNTQQGSSTVRNSVKPLSETLADSHPTSLAPMATGTDSDAEAQPETQNDAGAAQTSVSAMERLAALALKTAEQGRQAVVQLEAKHQQFIDEHEAELEALRRAIEQAEAGSEEAEPSSEGDHHARSNPPFSGLLADDGKDWIEGKEENIIIEKVVEKVVVKKAVDPLELQALKQRAQELEKKALELRADKQRLQQEAQQEVERREREAQEALRKLERRKNAERRRIAEELFETQSQLLQANLTINSDGTPVLLDRFVTNNPTNFNLEYGTVQDFRKGLQGLLGDPAPMPQHALTAMEEEHTERSDSASQFEVYNYGTVTTSEIEFFFVVEPTDSRRRSLDLPQWPVDKKLRAAGRAGRQPMSIRDFRQERARVAAALEDAGSTPLRSEEFFAARLYTGPMYMKYNGTLRGIRSGAPQFFQISYERLCQGNNYAATIHTINAALVKLSLLQQVQSVYRGVAGQLPKAFRIEDKYGARGGVEFGFMSTTTNRDVAIEYAASAPGALLLQVEQGMLDRGAELSFLSQYPGEAEVCFPPLTALEVVSSKVLGSILVVGTRPSLGSRPSGADDGLDVIGEELAQKVDAGARAILNTLEVAVQRLTSVTAVAKRTPIGEKGAELPPIHKLGVVRIDLVPPKSRLSSTMFHACLDFELGELHAKDARDAVIESLSDVLESASEIIDSLANGELAFTKQVDASGPTHWAELYVEKLFKHVNETFRSMINEKAFAEMKGYKLPPPAVYKIMTATLALVEGKPGGNALPRLDRDKLTSWQGVRSSLDSAAVLKALLSFRLSACSSQRWDRVNEFLDGVTIRDAMKSSAPLAALFKWIKLQELRADKHKLVVATSLAEGASGDFDLDRELEALDL